MAMTRHHTGIAAALVAVALLTGCNKGGGAPKGQVVATVNGDDITVHELNSELQQARPPADVPRKTVEQVVLARVIERKMLADVARSRNLDKNPDFILAERRIDDGLLVQALQSDIARKVPPPTREAAEKYIEAHPDQFAQRKVFAIDQIQFLRPVNIQTLGLEKANTMADVVGVLTANKIEFRRNTASVDALTVNPALVSEIEKILARNPQEVFMFADQPQGAPAPVMYVNKVVDTKVVPYTGEAAITLAQQLLQRDAVQKSLVANLATFRAAAKDKIKYAAGYGPPAAPAKPGAPAPAATPAATPAPATAPATAPAP
jgi:EpsD family peptidyl-prolyl cis-trans isomerase